MSNLSTIINDNQSNLKGAAFHYKAYAIVLFICGGLITLLGLPLLLLFGLGIIYIAFGVLYIFLGLNMLNASKSVKTIISGTDVSQDDYNTNSMNVIVELKKHFKILNIMMAVFLGLGLISSIALIAALPSLSKEAEKIERNYWKEINGGNDYLNKTPPNPYQTQSNKSLTASQMGMTDKEHAEMHDPKNIVNTDYSQLDYSNITDADIQKAEDAAMKAMDSMNPEQKAAMEKMMSEIKK